MIVEAVGASTERKPEQLWHDLRTAMREIRPDSDLSAPGLRW
jgi:hypothetical protein